MKKDANLQIIHPYHVTCDSLGEHATLFEINLSVLNLPLVNDILESKIWPHLEWRITAEPNLHF